MAVEKEMLTVVPTGEALVAKMAVWKAVWKVADWVLHLAAYSGQPKAGSTAAYWAAHSVPLKAAKKEPPWVDRTGQYWVEKKALDLAERWGAQRAAHSVECWAADWAVEKGESSVELTVQRKAVWRAYWPAA